MAMTNITIPNEPPAEPSQDFNTLKNEALAVLQRLAGETWTDHNLHDPGITMLEAACYAITDLGYRLDFPVEDLLAKANSDEPSPFPIPERMLSCHPVTGDDYRRLILDIPGVRNVLVTPGANSDQADKEQSYSALWSIEVVPEQDAADNLLHHVRNRFLENRNLGEDLDSLIQSPMSDITMLIQVSLAACADPVDTLASLLVTLADSLAPPVPFHGFDELVRTGHLPEDLNTGPWLAQGYLTEADLEQPALVERVYISTLMQQALSISGVVEVEQLKIAHGDFPDKDDYQNWVYTPEPGKAPQLHLDRTLDHIKVIKDNTPINIPRERLLARYQELRGSRSNPGRTGELPSLGRYRNLSDYLTLQHELPSQYGVGPMGLAPMAGTQRTAEVRQLQAYLLLFDQVLGNQFAQLDHLRHLLAQPDQIWLGPLAILLEQMLDSANLSDQDIARFWTTLEKLPHSHVTQAVGGEGGAELQELSAILGDFRDDYDTQALQSLTEQPFSEEQLLRMIRLGDHLLARSHEQLPDSAQLRYEEVFRHYAPQLLAHRLARKNLESATLTRRLALLKEVVDRASFIRDVTLSSERAQGSFYLAADIWGNGNVSGLRQRIYRQLGLPSISLDILATSNSEGFHLVEGVLLRHGTQPNIHEGEYNDQGEAVNAAHNVVYLLAPSWPSRLADPEFRKLFLTTVEQELPAHLHPCWIHMERGVMADFEKVYNAWRNAMTHMPREGDNSAEAQQRWRSIRMMSGFLHEFIEEKLNNGTDSDISGWPIQPPALGTLPVGQWTIGYPQIDALRYDPDIEEQGRIGQAMINPDDDDNPLVTRITPAYTTTDK